MMTKNVQFSFHEAAVSLACSRRREERRAFWENPTFYGRGILQDAEKLSAVYVMSLIILHISFTYFAWSQFKNQLFI